MVGDFVARVSTLVILLLREFAQELQCTVEAHHWRVVEGRNVRCGTVREGVGACSDTV